MFRIRMKSPRKIQMQGKLIGESALFFPKQGRLTSLFQCDTLPFRPSGRIQSLQVANLQPFGMLFPDRKGLQAFGIRSLGLRLF